MVMARIMQVRLLGTLRRGNWAHHHISQGRSISQKQFEAQASTSSKAPNPTQKAYRKLHMDSSDESDPSDDPEAIPSSNSDDNVDEIFDDTPPLDDGDQADNVALVQDKDQDSSGDHMDIVLNYFVVVRFPGKKINTSYHYVGKVINIVDSESCNIRYLSNVLTPSPVMLP